MVIGDIIRALIFASVPVAAFTFLVLQWSIMSGRLSRFDDSKGLEKQFKDHRKARKTAKAEAKAEAIRRKKAGEEPEAAPPKKPLFRKDAGSDLLHNKVMFFGGGYYGTMALFAYFVIEVDEIFEFLGVVFSPEEWFANLGFDLIIGFIINSFINIGLAFAWFVTLPKYISIGNGWIWLLATYVGYMVALKLVSEHGDVVWARLTEVTGKGVHALRERASSFKSSGDADTASDKQPGDDRRDK